MNPPAGRIQIGDQVALRDGRTGRVTRERYTLSNGSWRYTVELDGGGTIEALDYTLAKRAA